MQEESVHYIHHIKITYVYRKVTVQDCINKKIKDTSSCMTALRLIGPDKHRTTKNSLSSFELHTIDAQQMPSTVSILEISFSGLESGVSQVQNKPKTHRYNIAAADFQYFIPTPQTDIIIQDRQNTIKK